MEHLSKVESGEQSISNKIENAWEESWKSREVCCGTTEAIQMQQFQRWELNET